MKTNRSTRPSSMSPGETRQRRTRQWRIGIAVVVCALGSLLAEATSAAESIQSFVSRQEEWPELVGQLLTLEGRYSSIGGKHVRFIHCDLTFRSDTPLPDLKGASQTLEVRGRLKKTINGHVFEIDRLRQVQSDEATYNTMMAQIDARDPADWYKLAEWGKNRATFYDDRSLMKLALQGYQHGLEAEYKQVAPDDVQTLFQLAGKVQQWELPASWREEFLHEGHFRRWQQAKRQAAPDFAGLLKSLTADFPKSTQPLSSPQPKLRAEYLKSPVEKFRQADAKQREVFVRMLYSEIEFARIMTALRPDASNGYEVAATLDRLVPEKHGVAEELRERQLSWQLSRVNTSSRVEVMQLIERLRARQQSERAQATLDNWLKQKQVRLERDDITGRIILAEDYLALTGDRKKAAELLLEADKLSPGNKEVVAQLAQLGYELRDGELLTPKEVKNISESPIQVAMRQGRVVRGMTPEQVRSSLGEPTSIVRSIAAGGNICELWIFESQGATRLVVQLVRDNRHSDLEVVSVHQVTKR